jgi:Sperm-tail PG-rich repeat
VIVACPLQSPALGRTVPHPPQLVKAQRLDSISVTTSTRNPFVPLRLVFSKTRFAHFRRCLMDGQADVNGPGRCDTSSSIGAQAVSTRKSAPGYSMTSRPHDRLRETAPPPGSYEPAVSFGKQVLSRAASTPAFTMSSRHALPTSPIGPGPNIDAPSGVG